MATFRHASNHSVASHASTPEPGLSHQFDRPKYRQCNVVERLFSWLKEKRRLNTRYDKLATSFKAMVTLACIE